MSSQDEINVSVNSDQEEKTEAKKIRRVRKVLKKNVEKEPLREEKVEKEQEKPKKSKKGSNALSHFVVFVFTALVIGGAVYYWQNKMSEEQKENLSKEARNTRLDFEKRLEGMTDKLKGQETEFNQLKEKAEQLEGKASLLDGALIKFKNKDLGITFNYPASFGEVKFEITEDQSGKRFRGTFADNDSLVFGGVSMNYASASSSINNDFLDVKSYVKKGDGDKAEYFYHTVHGAETDYKIEPMRVVKSFGEDVLMVNKDSFVAKNKEDNVWDFGLGADIGALVKLSGEEFKGIAFINKSTAKFPLADFEETLKSIK